MKEKDLLEEQLEKLKTISPVNLCNWRAETLPIISEIFPEKTSQHNQFIKIGYGAIYGYEVTHIEAFKSCLTGMIKCLDIRKSLVNPKDNATSKQNISIVNNLSQSQTQNQNQTLNIEEIIKDELPPAKMREIEVIAKNDEPKETKLQKIGEVLQKTGVNVVSSTLAKIITTSMGMH